MPSDSPPTFRVFVEGTWKEACYDRCKQSTRQRIDSALRTQLLPEFGERRLDQICQETVHGWFERYSQTAPAGANRTLDVLRQQFNHAVECGLIKTNPARDVRRNPRPKPTRFLSRVEIDRLHDALDAHCGRGSGKQQAEIIRLLLLTGCRKSEIVRLRWSEVCDESLHLADGKTGPRTVALNAPARAILERQARSGSEYVFPSLADSSRCRSSELSLWRKVRREAKIEDVRLHDLRHTFASHAVMRSVPLPVVSRLLGHARSHMTLRYAHVSDQATEAAAERIGEAIWRLLAEHVPFDQDVRIAGDPNSILNTSDGAGKEAATRWALSDVGVTLAPSTATADVSDPRWCLGRLLDRLERGGEPILVCDRRIPVAALISLKDYRERVVDQVSGG